MLRLEVQTAKAERSWMSEPRSGQPWTSEESQHLKAGWMAGVALSFLARLLQRSEVALAAQLRRLNLVASREQARELANDTGEARVEAALVASEITTTNPRSYMVRRPLLRVVTVGEELHEHLRRHLKLGEFLGRSGLVTQAPTSVPTSC